MTKRREKEPAAPPTRSKTSLACTGAGAALALLVAGLLLAACGGGPAGPGTAQRSSGQSGTSAPAGGSLASVDACALMPAADAQAISAGTLNDGPNPQGGSPVAGGVDSSCDWGGVGSMTVEVKAPFKRGSWRRDLGVQASQAKSLSGVGDAAIIFSAPPLQDQGPTDASANVSVDFVKGPYQVLIFVVTRKDMTSQVIKAARDMASRLPA